MYIIIQIKCQYIHTYMNSETPQRLQAKLMNLYRYLFLNL